MLCATSSVYSPIGVLQVSMRSLFCAASRLLACRARQFQVWKGCIVPHCAPSPARCRCRPLFASRTAPFAAGRCMLDYFAVRRSQRTFQTVTDIMCRVVDDCLVQHQCRVVFSWLVFTSSCILFFPAACRDRVRLPGTVRSRILLPF